MRENGADLGRGTSDGLKARCGWAIRAVGGTRPRSRQSPWARSAGIGALGVAVHVIVGLGWGILFGLAVAATRMRRAAVVPAGIVYGIVVMLLMAFAVLPAAATLFGSGEPIRDMASMVGWGTFTTEHLLCGLVLGLTALPLGSKTVDVTTPTSAARPEPIRTRERVG